MRRPVSVVHLLAVVATVAVSVGVFPASAQAQTNDWITAGRGFWEIPANWSLAQAPTNTQSVIITNDVSKTVLLDATTSGSFSNTMTVSNLFVSAPAGVTNILALSDTGTNSPLRILDRLSLAPGGMLLMSNASLAVETNGAFLLEGNASLNGTNLFLGDLYVGFSTNSFGVINLVDGETRFNQGSTVIGFYGSGQAVVSNGKFNDVNVVIVTNNVYGSGIYNPGNGVFLGMTSGSVGALTVAGGEYHSLEHLVLGDEAGSTGSVWISDGLLMNGTNDYPLTIGNNGFGQLTISNGQLIASYVMVGSSLGSQGLLNIAGGTSILSRALCAGVAQGATGTVFMTGGELAVTNHSTILGDYGVGGMTVSNGSVCAQTIIVGHNNGAQGALTIAGGITTLTSNLVVGQWGATGSVSQVGGSLNMEGLLIASGDDSNGPSVVSHAGVGQVTISNGTVFSRTLKVGLGRGAQGALAISGGIISVASNLVAGAYTNATGVIQFTGGELNVTNQLATGQLVVGQIGQGIFTQEGGTLTVDQLLAINDTNSIFNFSSGAINSKSTTVSNAQTFVVGNGFGSATYHLLGGVHTFNDGLRIADAATLSGCGTINGSVVVDHGGRILVDCGGTMTFTGVITNNGLLRVANGSTLESYGTVVNNGVINILAGYTNFHAGFINHGVVLDASSIPQIVSMEAIDQDVEFWFTTSPGAIYIVEYRTDLSSGDWISALGVVGTGGNIGVIDPDAALLPQKFYRVRLEVPE